METLNIICDVDESDSKKPENEEKKEEEEPKEIIIEKEDNTIEELKKEEEKIEEEPKKIVIEKEDNIIEESHEEEKIEEESKEKEIEKEDNIIEESHEEEKIEEEPKEKEIQIAEIKEEDNIEKKHLTEKYFVIIYSREEKEEPKDMTFGKDSKIKPEIILSEEKKIHDYKYTYKKVLKFNNIEPKKKAEFSFFLGKDDYKYFISFEIEDKTFIYDICLEKRDKYLNKIPKFELEQKSLKYKDKFDLFAKALKKNNEQNKLKQLYFETIEVFSKKSSFSFLISLFGEIYKEKNSCSLLLKKFYEMNIVAAKGKKSNKNNSDRETNLGEKDIKKLMGKISEESEHIIKSNGYDPIHFYGILLCYFNYYDYNIFEKNINKLYKENSDILYEILLVYYSHFIKQLIEEDIDKNFFVNFFEYIISNKDFSYINIGLSFITNVHTFIIVIDETKEKIYNKFIKNENNKEKFIYIELEDNLTIKIDEINKIIKGIKSINEYSEKIKTLLVYFKSVFWKENLLKEFGKPLKEYFEICYTLRNIFFKYNTIMQSICDKERDKDIIEDITNFYNKDNFAWVLNDILKKFFRIKRGKIKNSEILGYIKEYNPYYQEEKFKNKRQTYILDNLDFEYNINKQDEESIEIHNNFIKTFKLLEYEDIFRENIVKFIDLMVKKIKDISSFDTVIDLISVDKIKEKVNYYIEKLKNKYEITIRPELKKLDNIKLKKTAAEIIAKFEKLIFDQENNNDFLRNNLSKLDICPLIYIQLIIKCKDDKYKKMKEFIYQEFLNNITIIDSIISLIDILDSKDKNNFLKELMKKCKFTVDEFYSKRDNNRINLLYALLKKKKIQKISGDIKTTLEYIFKDIDEQEIDKKQLEEFFGNPEEIIKRRLELVKLCVDKFEPENSYEELKRTLENINKDIKLLSKIKTSLSIFQKERYQEEIKQMVELINELYTIKLKDYFSETYYELIDKLKSLEEIAKQTESVQDFLLFIVLFNNAKGNNQEIRFNNAKEDLEKIKELLSKEKPDINELYKQNKETFDIIKKKLMNNKDRADKFFKKFKEFFKIDETKDKKEIMDDLTLIFNSKKYELDLNSIIYFFDNFDENAGLNKNLFEEYKNLAELDLDTLKKN